MSSKNKMVSKLLLPSGLACVLGLLALESRQSPQAAMTPATDSLAGCGSELQDLHFEMLAPNAEPQLPAGRGMAVCLAVYRVANVATTATTAD